MTDTSESRVADAFGVVQTDLPGALAESRAFRDVAPPRRVLSEARRMKPGRLRERDALTHSSSARR